MILAGGQQLPHSGTVVTRWQCCVGYVRRLCVRVCASACLPVFLCCCVRMHLLYFTQPLTLFFFYLSLITLLSEQPPNWLFVCVCILFCLIISACDYPQSFTVLDAIVCTQQDIHMPGDCVIIRELDELFARTDRIFTWFVCGHFIPECFTQTNSKFLCLPVALFIARANYASVVRLPQNQCARNHFRPEAQHSRRHIDFHILCARFLSPESNVCRFIRWLCASGRCDCAGQIHTDII